MFRGGVNRKIGKKDYFFTIVFSYLYENMKEMKISMYYCGERSEAEENF